MQTQTLPRVRHRRARPRPALWIAVLAIPVLAGGWLLSAAVTPATVGPTAPALATVSPPSPTTPTASTPTPAPIPTPTPALAPQRAVQRAVEATVTAPRPTPYRRTPAVEGVAAVPPVAVPVAPAAKPAIPPAVVPVPVVPAVDTTPPGKVWTQEQQDEADAACVLEMSGDPGATAVGMPAVGERYTVLPARRCQHAAGWRPPVVPVQ